VALARCYTLLYGNGNAGHHLEIGFAYIREPPLVASEAPVSKKDVIHRMLLNYVP
jgi:hypothetical protein